MRIFFIAIASLLATLQTAGQQPETVAPITRILFILDCSQSMAGRWENDIKINIARKFLSHTVDSLGKFPDVEMALRVYGHQSVVPPQDCNDTRLEVPFGPDNGYNIKRRMGRLYPKGTTPIANSLAKAAGDFPADGDSRNIIILITDGMEACDGDPCAVSADLQRAGILLKPFVIGIGLDPEFQKTFECLGTVYNASTEERFKEVLDIVVTHALTETTLQVNLLDSWGIQSETNVPLTFYNNRSGKIRYNFIHTLNNRGLPDTMRIDPLVEYRILAHTIPPVTSDTVILATGKHNVTAIDIPRGSLQVVQDRGFQYRSLEYIIRKGGTMETLWRQPLFEEVDLITGRYDLEIPTIPPTLLYNIQINQSEVTTVTLPQPGVITLLVNNPGICHLCIEKENTLITVKEIDTGEKSVPLILLPGKYVIIYRPLHSRQSFFTIVKRFSVESGRSSSLKII
ncbi:MAG: VWA domain-containing protein [Bacteroidales bacterium]|nr:VWA domain-containing protein [Bacteroidales bacterium]